MVDKPDVDKIKSKFDLGGIVDNLKSMINPSAGTPDVDPNDDLGVKIAEASKLLRDLSVKHQENAKSLEKINSLLNAVFVDVESLRSEVRGNSPQKPEVKIEESDK